MQQLDFDDTVLIDIETENNGYDIMNDNKRIISIQLLDNKNEVIFYDGSEINSLEHAKQILSELINKKTNFVGFNVINFDIRLIKQFLNIEIPNQNIIDISKLPMMETVRQKIGKNKPRLLEIGNLFEIDCSHKTLMDERAKKFLEDPSVIAKAKEGALKWEKELGWGYNFSYNLALNRISGGMAIFESFNDFVQSDGDIQSQFYKYAMGDVFVEKKLYEKMKKN